MRIIGGIWLVALAVACGSQATDSLAVRNNSSGGDDASVADGPGQAGGEVTEAGAPSSEFSEPGTGPAMEPGYDPSLPQEGGPFPDVAVACSSVRDAGAQQVRVQFGDEVTSLELRSAALVVCESKLLHLEACSQNICLTIHGEQGVITRPVSDAGADTTVTLATTLDASPNGDTPMPRRVIDTVTFPRVVWPASCSVDQPIPILDAPLWLELQMDGRADNAPQEFPWVTVRLSIPISYSVPGCLI